MLPYAPRSGPAELAGDTYRTGRGETRGLSLADGTRVAVAEGRVEVAHPFLILGLPLPFKTRRLLAAGQKIAAAPGRGLGPVSAVAPADVGAWRGQRLIYDKATLTELVADANRHRIMLANDARALAQKTLTGAFDARQIDRMLRLLTLSYPVRIDRHDPDTLLIRARKGE